MGWRSITLPSPVPTRYFQTSTGFAGETFANISIGTTNDGYLFQQGGVLNSASDVRIGTSNGTGTGSLVMTAGTFTQSAGTAYIGCDGKNGVVNLSGTAVLQFNQSGSNIWTSTYSGVSSSISVAGSSSLSAASNLWIATTGSGSLTLSESGTLTCTAALNVGSFNNGNNTGDLPGTGYVTVGGSSTATIATLPVGNNGGTGTGGIGTVTIKDSGTCTVSSAVNMGAVGSVGNLVVQDSGSFTAPSIYCGGPAAAGGTGTTTQTGGLMNVTLNTASALYVGYDGTGTLTQSGGTCTAIDAYLGYNTGATGCYKMTGGSLTTDPTNTATGSLDVGFYGAGTLTQTGGTISCGTNNGPNLNVGFYSGSRALQPSAAPA